MAKKIEEITKIGVAEFAEHYLKINAKVQGPAGREHYLKSIKTVDYVPFTDKLALVTRIVKATTEDEEGTFRQSSPVRYVLLVMEIIKAYTCLDIRSGLEMYEDYDILNKDGLIEEILAVIPDKEYAEFKTLTTMVQDDIIANKYESHVFFTELVTNFIDGADDFMEKVASALSELPDLSSLSSIPSKGSEE